MNDIEVMNNCKTGHPHKDELIRWANSPAGTKVWYAELSASKFELITSPTWGYTNACYIVDDRQAELRKALYLNPSLEVEVQSPTGDWTLWRNLSYKDVCNTLKYRLKPNIKRGDIVYIKNFAVKVLKVCGNEVDYLMPDATTYNTCTIEDVEGTWLPKVGDFVYVEHDVVQISSILKDGKLEFKTPDSVTFEVTIDDVDRVWYPKIGELVLVFEDSSQTFLGEVITYMKEGRRVKIKTKSGNFNVLTTNIAPYVGFKLKY